MVPAHHLGRDDLVRRVIALTMPVAVPVACAVSRCPNAAVSDGRGRCVLHKQTMAQRGYGVAHQRARAAMRLPAPCGYCGVVIRSGEHWVAAHVVDGDESAGWMVSHPICNERAKLR